MPDKDASTPRIFIIRHGETEWSKSGQYTGKTDIALTPHGEKQVKASADLMYGSGKLIDPVKIAKVFLSPRKRAIRTYELLSGRSEGYEITESLAEWDYGCAQLFMEGPSWQR
jgi:sedoheptulose-bisphosphatase